MAMSRQKKLDKMDMIELAAEKPKPEFHFKPARTSGKLIFETKDLVIGYDSPLSRPLNLRMERPKIALYGANGIGKTTLLKSLLGEIQPLEGSVERMSISLPAILSKRSRKQTTIRASKRYGANSLRIRSMKSGPLLAKCGLTTKHIESRVSVLSGGEKAKVRLCKLINSETNLLVLDEPTNHLDVDAKEELKRALKEYKGSILLISHEPDFYMDIATETWNCESWTTKVL